MSSSTSTHSTSEYGISYHSNACNKFQPFNHSPHHHDKEAYYDSIPPLPAKCHQRTVQFVVTLARVANLAPPLKIVHLPIEFFNFCSLSGCIVCRLGVGEGDTWYMTLYSPITYTDLSSCEAKIMATNKCVTELESVQLHTTDLGMYNASNRAVVYNKNQACIKWSSSVTTKGVKYLNLRKNQVRERYHKDTVQVTHIPGIINPSNMFTKEIHDCTHFRILCDIFMVSKNALIKYGQPTPADVISAGVISPYYSIRSTREVSHPCSSQVSRRVSFAVRPTGPARPSHGSFPNSSCDMEVLKWKPRYLFADSHESCFTQFSPGYGLSNTVSTLWIK